jgi:hypothetical protein
MIRFYMFRGQNVVKKLKGTQLQKSGVIYFTFNCFVRNHFTVINYPLNEKSI